MDELVAYVPTIEEANMDSGGHQNFVPAEPVAVPVAAEPADARVA